MCTGIKIDYNNGCVLGRTMDFEYSIDYNVLFFPRGYEICKDLMGEACKTKYETMGICFGNRNPLKDGINEHGLIGITNDFSLFNLYSSQVDKDKFNISSLDYMTFALGNYKSVNELVEDLDNINISFKNSLGEKVLSPNFHFYFTDSTKRGVVLEPKRGRLYAFENPYNVMTNSPEFLSHEKKLKKYLDIENLDNFNGAKNLPGGYDPSSRFIRAFYLVNTNVKAENYKEALAYGHNILGAMALPKGFIKNKNHQDYTYTRYICAYDSSEKILTVKSDLNPQIFKLSFLDIEDKKARGKFPISREFSAEKLIER